MSIQSSTLALEQTPQTALEEVRSNGWLPAANLGQHDLCPSELSRRLSFGLTLAPRSGENWHCDFNEVLRHMLARFDNCQPEQIESEFAAGFRRICEFLEVSDGACWLVSEEHCNRSVLKYFHGRSHERRGEPELLGIRDSNPFQPGLRCFRPGMTLQQCLPWVAAEVGQGKAVILPELAQLPCTAHQDKQALIEIGAGSAAILPLWANGKVLGALSFLFDRKIGAAQGWLTARLEFVTEVLAIALARRMREEALAKYCAEIQELKRQLQTETDCFKAERVQVSQAHSGIIGHSRVIKRVLCQVEQVAPADCAVLLTGETGTGKELIAKEIHRLSQRKGRIMVLVNCAALPSTLVESELFGRERGAYTGALTSQVGRFELANNSTILLDEVGELSLEVQAKLLRVLQQGEFQKLGSPKTHKVNVRIITATNRDLAAEVRTGKFREDLYYRLRVFPIELPPLRERTEDIPELVFSFLEEICSQTGKKITKVPRKSMEQLQNHPWPGNIRELRNVIERSVIVSSAGTLKVWFLGEAPKREPEAMTLAEAERHHIVKTLESTRWRIKGPYGAAARLAMQPSTLYSRMQKLGIPHRRQKDDLACDGRPFALGPESSISEPPLAPA